MLIKFAFIVILVQHFFYEDIMQQSKKSMLIYLLFISLCGCSNESSMTPKKQNSNSRKYIEKTVIKNLSDVTKFTINFGKVDKSVFLKGIFRLKNDLNVPITMKTYKKTCSCIDLKIPTGKINNNEIFVIDFSTSAKKGGHFSDSITIALSDKPNHFIDLNIMGYTELIDSFLNTNLELGSKSIGEEISIDNLLFLKNEDVEILDSGTNDPMGSVAIHRMKSLNSGLDTYNFIYNSVVQPFFFDNKAIVNVSYLSGGNVKQASFSISINPTVFRVEPSTISFGMVIDKSKVHQKSCILGRIDGETFEVNKIVFQHALDEFKYDIEYLSGNRIKVQVSIKPPKKKGYYENNLEITTADDKIIIPCRAMISD